MIDAMIEKILRQFRFVRRLERQGERLRQENERLQREVAALAKFFPPGHFYSPLPDDREIAEAFARGGFGPPFPGVDLREDAQRGLLEALAAFYPTQPFPESPTPGRRYHLDNPSYGHFDGLILHCMLRHLQPRRVIEVGSGFSSAAMLDTNELSLGNRMQLTFIDPDMSRLRPLLREGDAGVVRLIERRVQDVPLEEFEALEAGDVLFIDSSHVSKIGSDVNRLYLDVLPRLAPGVHVHIHDVAGNLEYPREWLEEGRAWNEQYLLRAFLMFNDVFEVELHTVRMINRHEDFFRERMPLCLRGGGGQLWLRRGR